MFPSFTLNVHSLHLIVLTLYLRNRLQAVHPTDCGKLHKFYIKPQVNKISTFINVIIKILLNWISSSCKHKIFLIIILKYSPNTNGVTVWKVSVFGVILVRTFLHLDWIRRDTLYLSICGKIRTRITPNTDIFYTVSDAPKTICSEDNVTKSDENKEWKNSSWTLWQTFHWYF